MTGESVQLVQLGSRYDLVDEIGRGSTATVWSGRRRDTGERVAVKVLHADLGADPDVVARFVAERGLLTAVVHPNLVRVHDLVVDGERLALVCDLVTGGTLRDRLAAGPMLLPDAVRIGHDIGSGLDALHRAGIVHADVKPENILLEEGGSRPHRTAERALLTDLGVSRLLGTGRVTAGARERERGLLGTPGYLAPEVALGAVPGAAADVYALGVVLYEMLTGQAPVRPSDDRRPGTRVNITGAQRPIPDVPREVWRLVGRCLRADPEARVSAREASEVLARREYGRIVAPAASPMTPPPPRQAPEPTLARLAPSDGQPTIQNAAAEAELGLQIAPGLPAGEPGTLARPRVAGRQLLTAALAAVGSCLLVLIFGLLARSAAQSSAPSGDGRDRHNTPVTPASGAVPMTGPMIGPVTEPTTGPKTVTATAERYDAPTGWLCRIPAVYALGTAKITIQPCIAVGATTARATLRHEIAGAVPSGTSLAATLRLLGGSESVASRTCDVLGVSTGDSSKCLDLEARAATGVAYRAVVAVDVGSTDIAGVAMGQEIGGSFGKSPSMSTPIVQNGSPQDRHTELPINHKGST